MGNQTIALRILKERFGCQAGASGPLGTLVGVVVTQPASFFVAHLHERQCS